MTHNVPKALDFMASVNAFYRAVDEMRAVVVPNIFEAALEGLSSAGVDPDIARSTFSVCIQNAAHSPDPLLAAIGAHATLEQPASASILRFPLAHNLKL